MHRCGGERCSGSRLTVFFAEWENTCHIRFHTPLLAAHSLFAQLLKTSLAQLGKRLRGLGHLIILVLHTLSDTKRTSHIGDWCLVALRHLLVRLSSLSSLILRGIYRRRLRLRLRWRIHWW